MTAREDIPERQRNLRLDDLRDICHAVAGLLSTHEDERAILQEVVATHPGYEERFLRWLVRRVLHPRSEDDIMADEIRSVREISDPSQETCLEIVFHRMPPTVRLFYIVQYREAFFHVIELDEPAGRALLKPLSAYEGVEAPGAAQEGG